MYLKPYDDRSNHLFFAKIIQITSLVHAKILITMWDGRSKVVIKQQNTTTTATNRRVSHNQTMRRKQCLLDVIPR